MVLSSNRPLMMEGVLLYILSVSLLAIVFHPLIRKLFKHSSNVPYPPGPKPLPIIGNLYDIPTDPLWVGYSHLAQKYGMYQDPPFDALFRLSSAYASSKVMFCLCGCLANP